MSAVFFRFFIIISSLISGSIAAAQSNYCQSASVQSVERPLSAKNPRAGDFTYHFGVSERANPDATLVIFIPGGPGQTSMDMPLSLPLDFAVVRTDPRGVGCNSSEKFKPVHLTSEEIARDVLAIVKKLQPKKYILHGISYGTVVATMAAALAEEEGVSQPAAVVLEGTMARVYQPNEYVDGYLKNWKVLKTSLAEGVSRQFAGPAFPFGFSSKEWAAWVSSLLLYGQMPSGDFAQDNLSGLDPQKPEFHRDILKLQVGRMRTAPTTEKIRLYKEIICRELVPDIRDVKYDFDFVNGDLVATKDRLCTGIPLSRPYDSAQYQIKAPIYYFSGKQDPATPPAQVLYHFQNQITTRTWVSVEQGGHQALTGNLMDCSENVWRAIDKNSSDALKEALSQCTLSSQVKIKSVELPRSATVEKAASLFQKMRDLYGPVVKRAGGVFSIDIKWESEMASASAHRNPKDQYQIIVHGGMFKYESVTADSLAITLCHEMGHLMGGEALRPPPPEWDGPVAPNGQSLLSAEGQSDYYATAACFRHLVKDEDHRSALKGREVSKNVLNSCDTVWGKDSSESFLCQRTALASLEFLNMVKVFPISFATPDKTVTAKTIRDEYPPRQCRLDTLVAGALCKDELPLDFNLQDKAAKSICSKGLGARPACWYKTP
ncbi:Alpha/beta hydrolase family protein [compost metagenome]